MPAWLCSSISSGARPAVLDRVAEAVQRPDAGVAAVGEDELARGAHADHLVIEDVRRHPDQLEVAAPLAQDLVAGGERDQVGEALEGDRVAVVDDPRHGLAQGGDLGHRVTAGGRGLLQGQADVVLGQRGGRAVGRGDVAQLGRCSRRPKASSSRSSAASWSSTTRSAGRATPAQAARPSTRPGPCPSRRVVRASASASTVTSATARFRPLAPVGGTMWAASPASSSER